MGTLKCDGQVEDIWSTLKNDNPLAAWWFILYIFFYLQRSIFIRNRFLWFLVNTLTFLIVCILNQIYTFWCWDIQVHVPAHSVFCWIYFVLVFIWWDKPLSTDFYSDLKSIFRWLWAIFCCLVGLLALGHISISIYNFFVVSQLTSHILSSSNIPNVQYQIRS